MNFRGWLSLQERITVAGQEFRDTDALAALKRLMSTHPNPENLVVTLTEIDKVGVNPKTQYETPLGIYFYPLDYAVGLDMRVPFAADVNFIQVCELTEPDKIIHMRPLTPQDPASFAQHKGVDMLYAAYGKENIDDYIEILRSQNFVPRSDYAVFYMLTALVAWHRNDQRDRVQPVRVRSNAPVWDELGHTTPLKARIRGVTGWNKVFRELGLAGIIDHGTETIYLDEPVQGVVFSAGALRRILSLENPKSPTAAPQYSRFGRQMVSNKPDQLAALTKLASKSIDDAKKYIRHTNFYNYRLRGSNLYANIMAATDGKIDEREMFSLLGNNRHLSAGELYALFANVGPNASVVDLMSLMSQENVDKMASFKNIANYLSSYVPNIGNQNELLGAIAARCTRVTAELADGVYQQVKKHTWAGMRSELESVKQEFAQIMEARGETELAQKIRSVK